MQNSRIGKVSFILFLSFLLATKDSLRNWREEWSEMRQVSCFTNLTFCIFKNGVGKIQVLYSCTISVSLEDGFVLQVSVQFIFEPVPGSWMLMEVYCTWAQHCLHFGNTWLFQSAGYKDAVIACETSFQVQALGTLLMVMLGFLFAFDEF